jgi:excisionase family DNA binding protein
MDKERAAEELGISVRTLQRMVKRGEIAVRYERGPKGDEAHFDEEDLRLYLERHKPALLRPGSSALVRHDAPPVVTGDMTGGAMNGAAGDTAHRMVTAFEALSVGNKLLLNLTEVRMLTGLSGQHLREAIHVGTLKGRIIGRGYKVKRADLEAYVRKL